MTPNAPARADIHQPSTTTPITNENSPIRSAVAGVALTRGTVTESSRSVWLEDLDQLGAGPRRP